jgi:hypothetical protein
MIFESKPYATGDGSGASVLGHATASSPLGPFTVDIYPLPSLSQASGASVDGPNLFYQNGKFVLFHTSRTAGANFPTELFPAESTDCINWTMTPSAPILTHAGMFGTGNQDQAPDPNAVMTRSPEFCTCSGPAKTTAPRRAGSTVRFPLSLTPLT